MSASGDHRQEVVFTVRANDQGGKRLERLQGTEFIGRFLLHVLPTGIKRIRHYGVLAPGCKGKSSLRPGCFAHASTQVASPGVGPGRSWHGWRRWMCRCPCCKVGRLRVVGSDKKQAQGEGMRRCAGDSLCMLGAGWQHGPRTVAAPEHHK
jgi:hypothetical protein